MVSLMSLVIPSLVAAVIVFIASSIIHMVLPIHKNDVRRVPDEDAAQNALRPLNLAPGDYALPHALNMKDPVFNERMKKGPVVFMTVRPAGPVSMGSSLSMWFVFLVVVSFVAAYITSRAVPAGGEYLAVFRFAGTTAFAAYGLGVLPSSIWWGRNWGATVKTVVDGFVYGLLTGGTFGWLWPAA